MLKPIIFNLLIFVMLTGSTYTAMGQYLSDQQIIESILKKTPKDTVRQVVLANSNERRGKKSEKYKADNMYENLGYKASVKMYNRLSTEEKNDVETLARIANSLRLNHDTEEAAFWYSRFVYKSEDPEHFLHYAQVLQSNGNCKQAVKWYKKYVKYVDDNSKTHRQFIEDCEEMNTFSIHRQIELYNVKALNTADLDFSPIPYGDGVVFTSTRGEGGMTSGIDRWTEQDFSDLFYAELKDGEFTNPVPLTGNINARYHDGVATFNQGESIMIFTRNNYDGKSKDGLIDLKIFMAAKEDGYWSEAEELPFNSDEFTTCHPTLSHDGRRLYFASNRPGGYGGLDLYVSEYMVAGWTEPLNMGPEINTAGNELFPYVGEDETLYYSSNGLKGMGGLDLFYVTSVQLEDETWQWETPQNMGKPFNSRKDDFGFWINENQNMGYLSSTRKGGEGEDDIYSWRGKLKPEELTFQREICVYDAATDLKIEGATVSVEEVGVNNESRSGSDLLLTLKPLNEDKKEYVLGVVDNRDTQNEKPELFTRNTDSTGFFKQTVERSKTYRYAVNKVGYQPYEAVLTSEELRTKLAHCLPLEKKLCVAFNGQVVLKDDRSLMPNAKVKVLNKCTNEEKIYTLDEHARFTACLECACEYRVRGYQDGYDEDYEFLTTTERDCQSGKQTELVLEIRKRKIVKIEDAPPVAPPVEERIPVTTYEPRVTLQPVTTYKEVTTYEPVTKYIPASEWTPDMLSNHFLGDPNARFEKGQVITLKDIYYDFDKYYIREDASLDLDRLLHLMRTYPSMEVSLESHTDSRGTDQYNIRLSSNRAKSARKYLITRGIEAYRIKAQGFGEKQLTNRCADNINCSEEEHQRNRRTEVRITKFNANGVKVIEPHR